jgi:putative ABC transport system permease protein
LPDSRKIFSKNPPALASTLSVNFQNQIKVNRFYFNEYWIKSREKYLKERLFFSDSDFFEIFNFPLLIGKSKDFADKKSIFITEDIAEYFFGNGNPLGEIIVINNSDFIVKGVFKKLPPNSIIKFKFLIPFSNVEEFTYEGMTSSWNDWGTYIFIKFLNNSDVKQVQNQFPNIIKTYAPVYLQEGKMFFGLQPITEAHLNSFELEIEEGNTKEFIYTLLFIGILILITACINFINLYVARASERMKELSVRRILGAESLQIFFHYLTESFLITFCSLILSVVMVALLLPEFYSLIGNKIDFNPFLPGTALGLILFGFLLSLLSGIYPAFYLTRITAINFVKINSGEKKKKFRRILILFQFAVSIFLLICHFIISGQFRYMQQKNLGIQTQNKIVLPLEALGGEERMTRIEVLKNEITKQSNFISASFSQNIPGKNYQNYWEVIPESWESRKLLRMYVTYVDDNFINLFKVELKTGRNFSKDYGNDPYYSAILNEEAVREIGWKSSSATGKTFSFKHIDRPIKVIGVAKDFHYKSLKNIVEPLILLYDPYTYYASYLTIQLNKLNAGHNIKYLDGIWSKIITDQPFEYFFLQDVFDEAYKAEKKTVDSITAFTIIALLIACMGLFSLTSMIVNKRTKEVGIRKVLGASIASIIIQLTKEFLILVAIANIIAWPIANIVMNRWLNEYPYRMELGFEVYFFSGLITFIIALFTIFLHFIKIGRINPIETLKYE